jgi:hypothetical protein
VLSFVQHISNSWSIEASARPVVKRSSHRPRPHRIRASHPCQRESTIDLPTCQIGSIQYIISIMKRALFTIGFALLVLFAVATTASISTACDECCSSGNCSDCHDCQCASSTASTLPVTSLSLISAEPKGASHSAVQLTPEQPWSSELERPPRFFLL